MAGKLDTDVPSAVSGSLEPKSLTKASDVQSLAFDNCDRSFLAFILVYHPIFGNRKNGHKLFM